LEKVQRKLAAIVAANVVGYSRLMGQDESATLARLKLLRREVVRPAVARHGGTVVKTTGDGWLLEFPSAVEAVEFAVALQREIADQDADRRLQLRIGINVGEIIVEDNQSIRIRAWWWLPHAILAAAHAQLGEDDHARDAIAEAVAALPGVSLASLDALPFRRSQDREHLASGLRKAGLQ
jgi:class 3 adenylate cyclase